MTSPEEPTDDAAMQFVATCEACGARVVESDGWFEHVDALERHLEECRAAAREPDDRRDTLQCFSIVAERRAPSRQAR